MTLSRLARCGLHHATFVGMRPKPKNPPAQHRDSKPDGKRTPSGSAIRDLCADLSGPKLVEQFQNLHARCSAIVITLGTQRDDRPRLGRLCRQAASLGRGLQDVARANLKNPPSRPPTDPKVPDVITEGVPNTASVRGSFQIKASVPAPASAASSGERSQTETLGPPEEELKPIDQLPRNAQTQGPVRPRRD